jgi:hypothetical protein
MVAMALLVKTASPPLNILDAFDEPVEFDPRCDQCLGGDRAQAFSNESAPHRLTFEAAPHHKPHL